MARPAWTSKDDPAYTIVGKQIVANQGNWRQGQTNDPLVNPRFVFAWRTDGGAWTAQQPPSRTRPAVNVPGTGQRSYDFSHLPAGAHTVTFQVFAGSFYLNPPHAGPDEEGEWIEWGAGNVTDENRGYVVDVPLMISDATPPPPPEPKPEPAPSPAVTLDAAQTKAINALYDLVEYRRSIGDSDDKIFGTLYYQVIRALGLPRGDGRRVKVARAIEEAIAS